MALDDHGNAVAVVVQRDGTANKLVHVRSLTLDKGMYRFKLKDRIARVNKTTNTTKAAFSKSVNCASVGLNSTRHPILHEQRPT